MGRTGYREGMSKANANGSTVPDQPSADKRGSRMQRFGSWLHTRIESATRPAKTLALILLQSLCSCATLFLLVRFFVATSLETWDVLLVSCAVIPALLMHRVQDYREQNRRIASNMMKQHPVLTHPGQWQLLPAVAFICVGSLLALAASWHVWGWANVTGNGDRATASLAVVGGLGLIVSLVVAYRKQASTERTETSRQINSAMQLLGEDKGTKRNAGVFALLDIGDKNPKVRQQIVNQLCRYLRTKRSDDASVESTIISELSQRLLSVNPSHWENIDIDLHGACLNEPFEMQGVSISSINCTKTRFKSPCNISTARIRGFAGFGDAEFNCSANFACTKFQGISYFQRSVFFGKVGFLDSEFQAASEFFSAKFKDSADFSYSTFRRSVNFNGIIVESDILLSTAEYEDTVDLSNIVCKTASARQEIRELRQKRFQQFRRDHSEINDG